MIESIVKILLLLETVLLSLSLLASSENVSIDCRPWFYYNSTAGECQCYCGLGEDLECTSEGVRLGLGHCMTYSENNGVYFAKCFYFQPPTNSIVVNGHFLLPSNVSELNDFMCGAMNRQGIVCEECIDNYAPSPTSFGYKCSKCSDSWSGVIVYLLVDFGAITIMYFVILLFRINMTKAPMTCFIMFSQLVVYTVFKDPMTLNQIVEESHSSRVVKYIVILAGSFYGIWNLDPLKYAVPPTCISTKLSIIHIEFLGCVSALYSFVLVFLTWIFVELRDHNFRLFVILWKPFHGCLVKLRKQYDIKEDIIDVFATFLLLSYSKFVYQFMQILGSQQILKDGMTYKTVQLYDPNIEYMSKEHLPFAIVCFITLILFVIPPPLILLLYPTKAFRWCLTKCRLEGRFGVVIYTFAEKFYGCYRDSLDGGRDMRYFSALYFLMRPLLVAMYLIRALKFCNMFFYAALSFVSVTIVIAYLKPYKNTFMNLSDTVLLAITLLMCLLSTFSFRYTFAVGVTMIILFLCPMILSSLHTQSGN